MQVKTADGYTLRVFCIGFTKRNQLARKKTAYAQSSKVRQIRQKMIDVISKEFSTVELKDVVNKLIPDRYGRALQVQLRTVRLLQREEGD